MAILMVQLIAPAQAVVAGLADVSETAGGHCMQHKDQVGSQQVKGDADCCQQAKVCGEAGCNQCQSCAAMVVLVNIHRQLTGPGLSATPLIHVADYLQGIPPKNLYHPPISIL